MKKLFALVFLALAVPAAAKVDVASLKVNHLAEPTGITGSPTFSWIGISDRSSDGQSAYEIKVFDIDGRTVWSTGKVSSDNSIAVKYAGAALKPASGYCWQVRIWDSQGKVSRWSAKQTFETGLGNDGWKAKWIVPPMSEASPPPP